MLNINNKNDIEKMKNYHRTRDMINLLLYFPQISPVVDLTIIESVEDYFENIEHCKKLYAHRIDSLTSKPVINAIETTGDEQNFVKLIEQIKTIDAKGVLVLFGLTNEYSERYERYAGISVGVSVGNGVYIDAVGKGYDGREVSKGIITHEGYFIPWDKLNECRSDTFKSFQKYVIDNKSYEKSRKERIKFLLSLGLEKEKIEKNIPIEYKLIPNFIWDDVIKKIIRKLSDMEDELLSVGFKEFAISGHTEGKRFLPWQMFDTGRYNIKKKQ